MITSLTKENKKGILALKEEYENKLKNLDKMDIEIDNFYASKRLRRYKADERDIRMQRRLIDDVVKDLEELLK